MIESLFPVQSKFDGFFTQFTGFYYIYDLFGKYEEHP